MDSTKQLQRTKRDASEFGQLAANHHDDILQVAVALVEEFAQSISPFLHRSNHILEVQKPNFAIARRTTCLSPVDLIDSEHDLSRPVEHPLRARHSSVRFDRLLGLQVDSLAHHSFEFLQPALD